MSRLKYSYAEDDCYPKRIVARFVQADPNRHGMDAQRFHNGHARTQYKYAVYERVDDPETQKVTQDYTEDMEDLEDDGLGSRSYAVRRVQPKDLCCGRVVIPAGQLLTLEFLRNWLWGHGERTGENLEFSRLPDKDEYCLKDELQNVWIVDSVMPF